MQRMTYDCGCYGVKSWQVKGIPEMGCHFECESSMSTNCIYCKIKKAITRLAEIENILGEEYEINRLRKMVEADREGRLVMLSEPMRPMVYKPNDTDVYCPKCGSTLSSGWPLSDADDHRKMCQCPYCGQAIDDTKCVPEEKGE